MQNNIEIKELSVRHGNKTVLGPLSLTLCEQRIAVLGRNGSGKTTFVRAIAGLNAVSGSVRVNGAAPDTDRAAAVANIGILFQNPDHQIIFPIVQEEIAFGLRQTGMPKADAFAVVNSILKKFDKADWAERAVSNLSQGQKHLVCLMAVLVMQPRIILLDEPFSGLDIPTTRAMKRYLSELEQTLIHVTHDPHVVSHYDRVLWFENGMLRMDDIPKHVIPAFISTMEGDHAGTDI